jgi:hypothetical protein
MMHGQKTIKLCIVINCIVLPSNFIFFLISLIMDGKLLHELGSSSDRSSDADFLAASMMHLQDVLGWYRNEIQMLSEFYADTEVTVGPAGTRYVLRGPLRLLHCLCC